MIGQYGHDFISYTVIVMRVVGLGGLSVNQQCRISQMASAATSYTVSIKAARLRAPMRSLPESLFHPVFTRNKGDHGTDFLVT